MLRALLVLGMLFGLPPVAQAEPKRVVSMNLCTDQLAMLVGPDQLISVSYLAQDPRSSAMVRQAQTYPANRGLAEDIFLLQPDLVIAGTYTTRATVSMLKRLGIPVVEFSPANSLSDVRLRIEQMGEALGQPDRAAELIAQFDRDLSQLEVMEGSDPRAATYYANSYTSGIGTLASSVMEAAGLSNIAAELGFAGGGRLPLESLVMAQPDLIITGRRFDTPALAEAVLTHPAMQVLQRNAGAAPVAGRDWVCGTPHVLSAIRSLVRARNAVLVR